MADDIPLRKETKYCNCAGCGAEISSDEIGMRLGKMQRPYCRPCLYVPKPTRGHAATKDDDLGPWGENAVRAMEDG